MTTPYTLPEPHITEWSKRGWANNFYAKYPPHDADITISLFTTEMMDAAYQAGAASRDAEVEALRKTTIKECAKVAGDLYAKYRDLYKGRVLPVDKEHWYNPHTDGMADGAGAAEDAILDLLNSAITAEATK